MSIHFISGKPGGGKSLYATKLIIDEFIHGDRQIVTNVPLLIPRFYEYVSEKFPVAVERRLSGGLHISEILTLFDRRGDTWSNMECDLNDEEIFASLSSLGVFVYGSGASTKLPDQLWPMDRR